MRRVASLFTLVLLLWVPAGVANADPAGPTNYRSTLTEVPPVDGLEVSVFGGDAFLVMTVEASVSSEVLVYGYAHSDTVADVYLRFSPDGTVEVNRRSAAKWKNEDRYEAVEVPDFVDPNAPPDWEVVASSGSYAWHDHRIHWMSSALPPTIDADGGVQVVPSHEDWRIPISVDGVEMEIAGTLTWEPSPTPVPWAALAVVVAVAGAVAGRRDPKTLLLVVGVAAALALVVGVGSTLGLPTGVGQVLPLVILPVVSLGAALAVRARAGGQQEVLLAVATLPLLAWGILQFGAITAAIVPSSLPVVLIRLAAAVAFGAVFGAVGVALGAVFGGDLADLASLADAPDTSDGDLT